jgi:hypothetical protein
MSRRSLYLCGTTLEQGPAGQIGYGLGMTKSIGAADPEAPTADVIHIGQEEVVDEHRIVLSSSWHPRARSRWTSSAPTAGPCLCRNTAPVGRKTPPAICTTWSPCAAQCCGMPADGRRFSTIPPPRRPATPTRPSVRLTGSPRAADAVVGRAASLASNGDIRSAAPRSRIFSDFDSDHVTGNEVLTGVE